ncbi:MAG: dihydroneopterin aldolase [Sulfurimonas sp.]|nr:dihydroneopterin aldolase [Sulfurimonas sp.]
MKIYIEDLKFQCIIGILDFERTTLQDVTLNITINYEHEEQFINYADVVNSVKFTMIEKKFLLIEDALDELSKTLQKEFSRINTLYLKITKPSILPDCKVSVSNTYNF